MQPSEAEVEALAEVFYEIHPNTIQMTMGGVIEDIPWGCVRGTIRADCFDHARAAFAHIAEHYRLERKEA